jgi:glycine cleavage system H protein
MHFPSLTFYFGVHPSLLKKSMPDTPKDYRFLETHEWHKREPDGNITLGISQLAADELTDITYVALPKVGDKIAKNGRWGEVESVKATSDLYSGVAGEIVAINSELSNNPGLINTDPYAAGWMIKIKPSDPSEFDQLLSGDDYLKKSGE